ncbi:MAG TPA: DctP family TRAP transporter solute-binding subunit [Arenicellales bacterium]|nr:DctP family TRAP transporter solute-binding subunit [Arenicellales bacterium]
MIALVTVLAMAVGQTASAQFTPKDQYNLSVVVGPQFDWGKGAERFADLVREKTDGQINIKVFYGGELFKGQQTSEFQLMARGGIDFAFGSTINWSPVLPELNVFSLPFFVGNYERLDRLEESAVGDKLFELMEQKGVKPLAWAENGFRQLTNSVRPVATPADVEGLKIRVVGSPIFIDIYRELGADPVSMNWGDAVTAFSQGVVDGQENPAGVLGPVKIWEHHQYGTFWNYLVDPLVVGVSMQLWNEFPPEIQEAVQEAAVEAARWEKAMTRRGLDDGWALTTLEEYGTEPEFTDYLEHLRAQGMEVTVLDESQQAEFRDALEPVYETWVPKIGEDLVEQARAAMSE